MTAERPVVADAGALRDLAVEVAREAGELLLGYGRGIDVDTKSSTTDPVSEADRASERLIAERLREARPDDALLGEEDAANRPGTSGLRWVVDPVDGTVNFLYGIPAWCVSICCCDDEGALAGVVHDPNRDETFAAVRGAGATLDGEAIAVNPVDDLAVALVATGFAYAPAVRSVQGRWVADLLGRARDVRRVGAAALDLAWTAAGRFDGFYEFGLKPWDRAAGELLVAEAGGVTSWREAEVAGERGGIVVAGGAAVHRALVAWLDAVTAHGHR